MLVVVQVPAQIDERSVRDAVAAVFSAPDYARRSVLDRLADAILGVVPRMLRWILDRWGEVTAVPGLLELLGVFILIVAAAIVGRTLLERGAWRLARQRVSAGNVHGLTVGEERDPWAVAQQEAAAGRFTEAAHALYRALLVAAARRNEVTLHPSKTVGDYARELRSRPAAPFARFREFARWYELVIYGIGSCDRSRYERLRALAAEMIGQHA